jgi:hypothetical protein
MNRSTTTALITLVKGGEVRELGLANKRLTSTRSEARRTLSAWRLG